MERFGKKEILHMLIYPLFASFPFSYFSRWNLRPREIEFVEFMATRTLNLEERLRGGSGGPRKCSLSKQTRKMEKV